MNKIKERVLIEKGMLKESRYYDSFAQIINLTLAEVRKEEIEFLDYILKYLYIPKSSRKPFEVRREKLLNKIGGNPKKGCKQR